MRPQAILAFAVLCSIAIGTWLPPVAAQPRGGPSHNLFPTVAVIVEPVDPTSAGRVKVRFPWLGNRDAEVWARIIIPVGTRGLITFPQIGDEVLVAFEHGDIQFPYVLGSVWNGH